jgi:hypothetical protein
MNLFTAWLGSLDLCTKQGKMNEVPTEVSMEFGGSRIFSRAGNLIKVSWEMWYEGGGGERMLVKRLIKSSKLESKDQRDSLEKCLEDE